MLNEVINTSFNGSQSFIVVISRFFLTFMLACVGSYSREYYALITRNTKKPISFSKILICSIFPSLLAVTFFDGIVNKLNLGAILLFSFVTGFLGLDLLKTIKKLGVKGVWKLTVEFFTSIAESPLRTVLEHSQSVIDMIKKNTTRDDNDEKKTKTKKVSKRKKS